MKKYICYLFLAGLMIGCSGSGDGAGDNSANNDVVVTGDTIRVSQTSAIASKLVVDSVKEILYTPMLTTTGVVTAIPTGYASLTAAVKASSASCAKEGAGSSFARAARASTQRSMRSSARRASSRALNAKLRPWR